MDGRLRKTVHPTRRPEERPKDASHPSTFTECTSAMLTLPSFAGPTSARSVTRTVRTRFSVGTPLRHATHSAISWRDIARQTLRTYFRQLVLQADRSFRAGSQANPSDPTTGRSRPGAGMSRSTSPAVPTSNERRAVEFLYKKSVADVGRSVRFGWPSMPAHSRPSSNEIVIANPGCLS